MEFSIAYKDGVMGEDDDFLETDRKWGNSSYSEEGAPKFSTDTGVPNIVSLIATRENTSLILGAKPRPGTPVVGNSKDIGEGQGK